MLQHVCGGEQHCSGISHVLEGLSFKSVSRSRLVDNRIFSNVLAGRETGSSDQTGPDVAYDVAVQIGHNHDVELVRVGHQLHAAVVYDSIVELNVRIELRHFFAAPQEQPVRQLHYVSLVYRRYELPVVSVGKVKCKLCNAQRFLSRYDFEVLNYSWDALVLQPAVLPLCVLADNHNIQVRSVALDAGDALAVDNVSEQIEFESQLDVEGPLDRSCVQRSVQHTFESNSVPVDGGDSFR